MKPSCIAISGTDPTCGAGAQLDIQVLNYLGIMPFSVITAVTIQNVDNFKGFWSVPCEIVKEQLETILTTYEPCVCKIGMLTEIAMEAVISVVGSGKLKCPIILDPILKSSSGFNFIDQKLLKSFFKNCFLVTPNIPEVESFLDTKVRDINEMERATVKFAKENSCPRVLLKGGHLRDLRGVDILYSEGVVTRFTAEALLGSYQVHGTGCFLSSAISGYLALGEDLTNSISLAKKLLCEFMERSHRLESGDRKLFNFFMEKGGK